jgi:ubiquinone/menaquinone biosynthesis C-methylase UbiE
MNGRLEKEWHARYERWAASHASEHLVSGWSERGLSRRLALVLQCMADAGVKPGSRMLDLGAGPGVYTRSLKEFGHSCLGLDYSRKVLAIAKSKDRSGDYVQGEAYSLPFKQKQFDGVICIGVLQSLSNVRLALSEIKRVLAPGGYLFVDGLNSLYWVHSLKTLKETLSGAKNRMSYYNPFHLADELEKLGFAQTRMNWLAMPESVQPYVNFTSRTKSLFLSPFFGYAFLISTQKRAS